MDILDKYKELLNNKIEDFKQVRELLQKDNIEVIEFKQDDDKLEHHNKILIDFFNINPKNHVKYLDILFFEHQVSYQFYTVLPLQKLFKKQELSEKDDEYEQLEILLPSIQEKRFTNEIIEPLKIALDSPSNAYIHLNTLDKKQKLTKFKYTKKNGKELEIIKAQYDSKNPIYGLLYYMNLDYSLFYYKYLVLQELETIKFDKHSTDKIEIFFNTIKLKKYRFNFEVIYAVKNYKDKLINLAFYKNDDHNESYSPLSFNSCSIQFIFELFENMHLLEFMLNEIYNLKRRIKIIENPKNIEIVVNNETFTLEKDIGLLVNFIKKLYVKREKSFLENFKDRNTTYYTNKLITKENFYDYYIHKFILDELDEKIR